jgi:uncharacterized membrane protein YdjX (TVP38/TMEM64 family)
MIRWLNWGSLAGLALVAVLLLGRLAGDRVPALVSWVEGLGPWAPAALIVAYTVGTVALVPGSLLTLAAGALFGVVRGTVYALLGASLGAVAAFLIARHLARGPVERRVLGDPRFQRIDEAIGREGRRVVFLLRLSPVFPFTLLNYALGLTRVRFFDYLLGCLGMLPGTLLYVYQGKLVGEVVALGAGEVERGPGYYSVLVLGLAATVVVTVLVTRLANRALKEETSDAAVASAG